MSRPKAVIAEADPFLTVRLRRVLEGLGYAVEACLDGHLASDLVKKLEPQLVLTDLSLPLEDGFQVIERARKHAATAKAYCVAISGVPSLRGIALKRKEELGIDEILSPSYDDQTLSQILRRGGEELKARRDADDALRREEERREEERLALIAGMGLVDGGPPEAGLQKLVEDAARLFHVPIALVSLVLEDRQFFKAHTGLSGRLLEERGTEREASFCSHLVAGEQAETLVVPDARQHPLFKDNRLVREGALVSYVGAPLRTPGGQVLGSLCLIDTKPSEFKTSQIALLNQLARRAAGELELAELPRQQAHAKPDDSRLGLLASLVNQMSVGVLLMDAKRKVIVANQTLATMVDRPLAELVSGTGESFARGNLKLFDEPGDYLERMRLLADGPYVADEVFIVQRPRERPVRWIAKPVLLPEGPGQLDLFIDLA